MDPGERPGAPEGRAKQVKLVPRDVPRSPRGARDRSKGAQEHPRMDEREPKGSPKVHKTKKVVKVEAPEPPKMKRAQNQNS